MKHLRLEGLETRINPINPDPFTETIGGAIIKGFEEYEFALFSTANPGTPFASVPIGGLDADEEIQGVDANPVDGRLYTLIVDGTVARVARLDPATGATTPIGSTFAVSGGEFGFDFNPVTGLAHVVTDADQHLTFDPATGAVAALPALPDAASMQAIAFSNSVPGATATTLYGIDANANGVSVIDPATSGLTPLNAAGFNVGAGVGFDIGPGGQSFATFQSTSGPDHLYGIPLAQQQAVLMGEFAADATVVDLALFGTVTYTGRTASFTDVDGDQVKVKLNRGIFGATELVLKPAGKGFALRTLDLSDPSFAGTSVSITAKRGLNGDGFVNVETIAAIRNNLGVVTVDGDLDRILAGNPANTASEEGVRRLTVREFRIRYGGDGVSRIEGAVSRLTTKEGIREDMTITVDGNIGAVVVGGSIVHSTLAATGSIGRITLKGGMRDATIAVDGNIGAVMVGGSVVLSTLAAGGSIGRMVVDGDFYGEFGGVKTRVIAGAVATEQPSIGRFVVKGGVAHAKILAGFTRDETAVNGDADIGRVVIGLEWTASDLVAGVAAGNGIFGDDDDASLAGESRIKSVVIKGQAAGSVGGTDHFGVVADEVGSMKLAGVMLPLTDGLDALALGLTGDVRVREVAD